MTDQSDPIPRPLREIADRALALVAAGEAEAANDADGADAGRSRSAGFAGGGTVRLALANGAAAPVAISDRVATRDLVSATVGWRAAYTLTIDAPRRVLEVAWSADEPVRIMVFSRGDWEADLFHQGGDA